MDSETGLLPGAHPAERSFSMPKLRKMLGDISHPTVVALMRLIETQSKATLAHWTTDEAELLYLPIYERRLNASPIPRQVIAACRAHLDGALPLAALKPLLKQARTLAAAEADPTAQAAARAIATGCATITTPTNALGYLFYGAAAVAYDRAGLSESAETYDALAVEALDRALKRLQAVAIPDELNPAKINWNC